MSSSTDVCGRACSYTLGRKTTRVNGVASRERRPPRQAGCCKENYHDAEPLRSRAVSSSSLPGVAARGRARAAAGATAPAQAQCAAAPPGPTDAVLARPPHEAATRITAAYGLRKENVHAYSYCRWALCLWLARLVIGGLLCSSRQCAPAGKHVVDLSRRFQCVYRRLVARWEIPGAGRGGWDGAGPRRGDGKAHLQHVRPYRCRVGIGLVARWEAYCLGLLGWDRAGLGHGHGSPAPDLSRPYRRGACCSLVAR